MLAANQNLYFLVTNYQQLGSSGLFSRISDGQQCPKTLKYYKIIFARKILILVYWLNAWRNFCKLPRKLGFCLGLAAGSSPSGVVN